MSKVEVETEVVEYPCPNCGTYNKPYMHTRTGYAYMICSNCKVQYKTSTKVSANFRKFCSKVARKPNRSQGYYTPQEEMVRKVLLELGLREGIDFVHNCRVKNGRSYYWIDFMLHTRRLAIEVDPSVWHRKRSRMSLDTPSDPRDDDWIEIDQSASPIVWNRGISDQRKEEFLVSNGFRVIHLSDSELKSIDRIKEVIEGCL